MELGTTLCISIERAYAETVAVHASQKTRANIDSPELLHMCWLTFMGPAVVHGGKQYKRIPSFLAVSGPHPVVTLLDGLVELIYRNSL